MQAPEPKGRQRVQQCASKHKHALGGCLAVVALYLLWMAWASLSGNRGEPGWVHRRERGSGSIGTFRLRYASPSQHASFHTPFITRTLASPDAPLHLLTLAPLQQNIDDRANQRKA